MIKNVGKLQKKSISALRIFLFETSKNILEGPFEILFCIKNYVHAIVCSMKFIDLQRASSGVKLSRKQE